MTYMYSESAWLIPLLPFLAFLFLISLGKGSPLAGKLIAIPTSLLTLALSILVLIERFELNTTEYNYHFTWLKVGPYSLQIGFEITNTISLLLVIVSAFSVLLYIFSAVYLRSDERMTVFFSYISLLMFAILGMIIADNLFMFYILWDLAGIASFLFIMFRAEVPLAHKLTSSTFSFVKIGDACLLFVVVLLLYYMPDHSVNFTMIQNVFHGSGSTAADQIALLIGVLLIVAIASRTLQFPFYIATPAITAAPLPVYALSFGGIMIVPAVVLIIRMLPVLEVATSIYTMAYWLAVVTMLISALLALGARKASNLLLYLAMNQLSFILLGAISGALQATLLYMGLFVFVQMILYMVYRYHNRWTKLAMVAAALSYMAIPPFAPFWSKGIILHQLWQWKPALALVVIVASGIAFVAFVRLLWQLVAAPAATTLTIEREQDMPASTIQLLSLVVILLIVIWTVLEWKMLRLIGEWLDMFQYQWQEWFFSPWQQPVVWVNIVVTLIACVSGVLWQQRTDDDRKQNLLEEVTESQFYTKEIIYYIIVWPYRKLGWLLIAIALLLLLLYGKELL